MEPTIIASVIGLIGTIAAAIITAKAKDKSYAELLQKQQKHSSVSAKENYGIKIVTPENGDKVGETIRIRGVYNELPIGSTLQIFTISKDRQYRPQQEARVTVDKNSKEWRASLSAASIEMETGKSKTIGIALMGDAGDALCEYFWKAGHLAKQYPGIEKLTPDIIFYGEVVVSKA